MAEKHFQIDSSAASGTKELDQLDELRLEKNWSYRGLAEDMRRVGFYVNGKTLQSLLKYRPKPYDRTLHRVRQYLAVLAGERSGKPQRKTKGRAA